LVQAVDREAETASERTVKSPRYGVEGCCGKGCNGCLVFWHDPAYAKAREKLSAKKQGEKLEGDDTKPVAAE
ncbi:MAG: hypothetical protein EP347_11860, partial [Alphaproteobacteria bacterium]